MARQDEVFAGRALAVMRTARGWSSKRLATALGMRPAALYAAEGGDPAPSRELLERAAVAMGYPLAMVESTLLFLRSLGRPGDVGVGDALDREIDQVAAELGVEVQGYVRAFLGRVRERARAVEARQLAPGLWARLSRYGREEQQALVEEGEEFQSWALAELLCRESVAAAPHSADRAVELAELAVEVARRVAGTRAWRSRVQGWAWAHLANARRVKGDLPKADAAFARANDLWEAGAEGDPEGLFDEVRMLDLEASLRREQRRLEEALGLIDDALVSDRGGARTGRLLVKRAKTLEELGRSEEAVTALRQAEPLIDAEREPRLVWACRQNLLVNLCDLGRHGEAERLLPDLRALTLELGNRLDLLRLLWLEGKIAAGLGRSSEAEAALDQVRADFTALAIPYDAALAALDLAVLLLEQGRDAEVVPLALGLAWVFEAEGVDREALAALTLFRDAAAAQTLTVEAARRLRKEVERARCAAGGSGEGPAGAGGRHRPGRETGEAGR